MQDVYGKLVIKREEQAIHNVPMFWNASNIKKFLKPGCLVYDIRYKSKSSSSQTWLSRHKNDCLTIKAKSEHYRSRAAYKLLEISQKFRLFNKNTTNIVDLGFAPGAWTQVALEKAAGLSIKPLIVGVDINDSIPPEGAFFIKGDIMNKSTHEKIRDFFNQRTLNSELHKPVHLILSDMMVNTSGIKDSDHFASMELCDGALFLACNLLRKNGNLVVKFYTGKEDIILKQRLDRIFQKVYRMKPSACRDESREMYFIALKKKTDDVNVKEVFR